MLPLLTPVPNSSVNVQQTTFSHDMLGRWACSTWEEVRDNGGDPFDVVVIGAGMFGGYLADKLYRRGEDIGLRVLVLDAGSFLLATHVQNLPRIGLFGAPEHKVASNAEDPGTQKLVWGYPWHSHQSYPGQAYCIGGRSLFWGGWAPRLTDADFGPRPAGQARWPQEVAEWLKENYRRIEEEMGVWPTTDYISGPLFERLRARFEDVKGSGQLVEEAPLAVQGQAPESGLFSFDKYSSAYLLFDAIREDIHRRWRESNAYRRLMLLPRAQVTRLLAPAGRVTEIELLIDGRREVLRAPLLAANCAVVLAAGTIESTRLVMDSLPAALPGPRRMGSNLMAHLRSDISARVSRAAIPGLSAEPDGLEMAALLVRGATRDGHQYHFQVTASAGRTSDETLFTSVPDLDLLDRLKANQQRGSISITLRAIGEMYGSPDAAPGESGKSWMDLAWQDDPRSGRPRAWVQLDPSAQDQAAWTEMEQAAVALLKAAAGGSDHVQNLRVTRNSIGGTHHEAGTLWMGKRGESVTDVDGRLHHVPNVYVAGPAVFPTGGSANPALTATALASRTADAVVLALTPAPAEDFRPLFTGSLQGWQMSGGGTFVPVSENCLEARPSGLGVLWYKRQVFKNFVLRLDWLSYRPVSDVPGQADNAGVFLRIPTLNASDPANDWRLAVDRGYEVQIDDMGFNPETRAVGDPLHQTSAIYALAPPARLASRPAGQWNTFEIEATSNVIKVKLNGELVTKYSIKPHEARMAAGHIGLQCHSGNVRFQNIMIKSLPDSA